MLNLADIRVEIDRLEKGNTSYDTCEKLACLYTILEHHKDAPTILSTNDNVVKEYSEILPSYSIYCSKKRMYQFQRIDQQRLEIYWLV